MSLYSKLCLNINSSERHVPSIHLQITHFPPPVTHCTFFILYYCFLYLWAFGIILCMFVYSLIVCLPDVSSVRAETWFCSARQPKSTHHILYVESITSSECRSLSAFSSPGSTADRKYEKRRHVLKEFSMFKVDPLCKYQSVDILHL